MRPFNRIAFRAAVPADAPELSQIAITAKRHWGYPDEWLELWRRELTVTPEDIGRDFFKIAEVSGQTAGFVSVSRAGADAEIEHLWVLPGFIGMGVGRRLLEQALAWCASGGVASLKVVADPNAIGFYLAAGGKVIGRQASVPAPRELPVVVFSLPRGVSARVSAFDPLRTVRFPESSRSNEPQSRKVGDGLVWEA